MKHTTRHHHFVSIQTSIEALLSKEVELAQQLAAVRLRIGRELRAFRTQHPAVSINVTAEGSAVNRNVLIRFEDGKIRWRQPRAGEAVRSMVRFLVQHKQELAAKGQNATQDAVEVA